MRIQYYTEILSNKKQSKMFKNMKDKTTEMEPINTMIIVFKQRIFYVAFYILLKLLI
jgi:hypothetical protein